MFLVRLKSKVVLVRVFFAGCWLDDFHAKLFGLWFVVGLVVAIVARAWAFGRHVVGA